MSLWQTWVCGSHWYMADMGLRQSCLGQASMGLCQTCVYSSHGFVTDVGLWQTWVYGGHGYVADVGLWPSWVCGRHESTTDVGLWQSLVNGSDWSMARMGLRDMDQQSKTSKVCYGQESPPPPQWRIYYHSLWGQLLTACINATKVA